MRATLVFGVLSSVVFANGTVVTTEQRGGAAGTLRPMKHGQVKLVREALQITVGPDEGYQVHARYTLSNPGAPVTVLYGVPLYGPNHYAFDARGPEELRLSSQLPKDFKLTVAGNAQGCERRDVPSVPELLPAPFSPVEELSKWSTAVFAGYCTASLELPTGEFVLELEYAGELFSQSSASGPSSEQEARELELVRCVERGPRAERKGCQRDLAALRKEMDPKPVETPRVLHYPFAGAGNWASASAPLTVEISLGRFKVASGAPAGSKTAKGVLTWSTRVSSETPALELVLVPPGLKPDSSSGPAWTVLAPRVARASSVLPAVGANSYGPEMAIDRDPATAWCAKNERGGVGEWIELEFDEPLDGPLAWGVVTGLGKSAGLWKANARPTKLWAAPCQPSSASVKIDLSSATEFGKAGVVSFPVTLEGSCVRFEVEAVARGEKYPEFCISEVSVAKRW